MRRKPTEKKKSKGVMVYLKPHTLETLKHFADIYNQTLSGIINLYIVRSMSYEVKLIKDQVRKAKEEAWSTDVDETLKLAREIWGEDNQ